jgi:hypothetical protein
LSTEICALYAGNILLAKKAIILLVETQGLLNMRNKISMKRLLPLLAALLLLLSGCVEYDEELWLNSNGSGRAKVRLVHRSYYANTQEIMNKLDKPGIHLEDIKRKQSGPHMIYEVELKFDSIEAFNSISDQLWSADFWGNITLAKNAKGNIEFQRLISLGSQNAAPAGTGFPSGAGENYPAGDDSSMFAAEDSLVYDDDYINSLPDDNDILQGIYMQEQTEHPLWTYKLHLPWKIIHAGDNSQSIDHANKVVTWKFDTLNMWNKKELMTVEMKKGLSWIVYALIGLAGALVLFFIIWMIRINRRSHLHDAIKHHREREHLHRK